MDPRRERRLLAAIVAVGFLVRAIGLSRESYWFDELLSLSLADKPLAALLRELAAKDVHPPLFFVLLRGVRLVFGTHEVATRALSLVAGTGAIVAAFALARSLWKRADVALVAAAFVACSPISVYYARELRPYALLELLVLSSSALLVRAAPEFSAKKLALYVPVAALLPYTHVFGFFTLAAHGLFVLARADRRALLRGALALACVLALYLPWLPITLRQVAHVEHGFWIERPDLVVYARTLRDEGGWSLTWVVCTSLAAIAGIVTTFRRGARANALLLAASIAIPVAVPIALSWLSQPIFMGKYAIGAAAILLVAAAPAVVDLSRAHLPAIATALGLAGLGETIRDVHGRLHHEQWREVASFLADEASQHRPTVIWHDQRDFFAYYLGRPRTDETFWLMWHWELTTPYREGIVSRVHALGGDRFWVLRMRGEDDPALEEVLRERFVPVRTARWIGCEATEWRIPAAMAGAPSGDAGS